MYSFVFFNESFRTQPLTLKALAIALVTSSIVFRAVELEKIVKRKRK